MSARFAGSRLLDARRRRRLAAETEDELFLATTDAGEEDVAPRESSSERAMNTVIPFRRLISPRLWKHILFLALGLGLISAVIAGGVQAPKLSGPAAALRDLLSFERAPIATWVGNLLLFLSAQLAAVVWFVRRQSEEDFAGRYWVWGWFAATLFFVAFANGTGLHLTVQDFAANWLPDRPGLVWIVPMSVVACGLLLPLHRDMRGCGVSLSCLWLGLACLAGTAVVRLDLLQEISAADQPLATVAGSLLGVYFLFEAMLLHARHVLFESPEPPVAGRSGLGRLRRRIRLSRELRRRRRAQRKVAELVPEPIDVEQTEPADPLEEPVPSQPESPQPTRRRRTNAKATPPAPVVEEPESEPIAQAAPDDETIPIRADGGLTEEQQEMLKGLSKREKRQLRKQWRDEARAKAG